MKELLTKQHQKFIIDDEDYELIAQYNWYTDSSRPYIYRRFYDKNLKKYKTVYLHRFICNTKDNKEIVDHINHNIFDNRRKNLRICTRQNNNMNKLPNQKRLLPKGVFREKSGKYRAAIMFNKKFNYIGIFNTPEEAGQAYNKKALELFEEYACLNLIKELI